MNVRPSDASAQQARKRPHCVAAVDCNHWHAANTHGFRRRTRKRISSVSALWIAVKDVDTIINGHMPTTTTWTDLKEYADYMTTFVANAESQMKAGKSADEAAAGYTVPERFRATQRRQARPRRRCAGS